MSNWAIIVAAGESTRFGGQVSKQFTEIAGYPTIWWTVKRFHDTACIDQILVVARSRDIGVFSKLLMEDAPFDKVASVTAGGGTRQQSVLNGLEFLGDDCGLVAIHDGARPLVSSKDIERVFERAAGSGAAILGTPVTDTIKRVSDEYIVATLDRTRLFSAQTPQVFEYQLILDCHHKAKQDELAVTDDASVVEACGYTVAMVEATGPNHKITTLNDLPVVRSILEKELQR